MKHTDQWKKNQTKFAKTWNKDPDRRQGKKSRKIVVLMKTKPRTVDKYTIISITMHLICVFIYNILDFRMFFLCRLLLLWFLLLLFFIFFFVCFSHEWNEEMKRSQSAYLRIYIVCIENNNHCLFEIIYGNLVLVLFAALTTVYNFVYFSRPQIEITFIDMMVDFNQNDEIPFYESIV